MGFDYVVHFMLHAAHIIMGANVDTRKIMILINMSLRIKYYDYALIHQADMPSMRAQIAYMRYWGFA